MSSIQTLFQDYRVLLGSKTIVLGDNKALDFGSVFFKFNICQSLLIKDTLHIPRLAKKKI